MISTVAFLILWYALEEIDQWLALKGSKLTKIERLADVMHVEDEKKIKEMFDKAEQRHRLVSGLLILFTVIAGASYYFFSFHSILFSMFEILEMLTFFSTSITYAPYERWRRKYYGKVLRTE
ncbi:hypothetical protein [Furfurilactobacillus entadae]|uniref:hypothetical protein n=1 Tax=Furfurilactobacillus entadae TaxID=2922307 RepID=UPI0035E6E883